MSYVESIVRICEEKDHVITALYCICEGLPILGDMSCGLVTPYSNIDLGQHGLLPMWHQNITCTNADLLPISSLGTNFLCEKQAALLKKIDFQMLAEKRCSCSWLSALKAGVTHMHAVLYFQMYTFKCISIFSKIIFHHKTINNCFNSVPYINHKLWLAVNFQVNSNPVTLKMAVVIKIP